jgi:hypothetical protein
MHIVQVALGVFVIGLFALVGFPLAAAGILIWLQRWYLTLFGERTVGTVLGFVDNDNAQPSERSTGESSAFLRISFIDCYGKEHRVTTDTSVSPQKYRVGDPIPLLYRLARPRTFVVDRFWMKWTIPLIFGGIGFILLLPVFYMLARAWPD